VDLKFNAWARYPNFAHDDVLPKAVADTLGLPRFEARAADDRGVCRRFVLEGGSIDINGRGSVLTTEECLLSRIQQRNPGFSRGRIEEALRDYLGVEQVLWLGGGIMGDDTHGHVDDLARFVNATTIVAAVETDRGDVNYRPLQDNLRRLKKMRDRRGRRFEVVELPMPGPVTFGGRRLPASYANFYIANAGVLVPVFNDPADVQALRILEGCFKDRPLLPVYCRDLVLGLGTLHCLTQQQPATDL
jgi:agmatine deiminase